MWFGGVRPAARGSGGMLRWDARCRWSPSWPAGAASWPGKPAAMRGGRRARRGQSAKAPHSPGSGLPDGETHLPQARWKPDEARWGAATEPSRRLRTARGARPLASAASRGMGGTREWPESDCPAARGARLAAARRGVAARGARPSASAASRGMSWAQGKLRLDGAAHGASERRRWRDCTALPSPSSTHREAFPVPWTLPARREVFPLRHSLPARRETLPLRRSLPMLRETFPLRRLFLMLRGGLPALPPKPARRRVAASPGDRPLCRPFPAQ